MRNLFRFAFLLMSPLWMACGSDSKPNQDQNISDASGTSVPASDASFLNSDAVQSRLCEQKDMPREIKFLHGGIERSALLAGPDTFADNPIPLILNYHGHGDSPEQEELYTDMSAHAVEKGYIVAYPRGLGEKKGWNSGDCCGYPVNQNVDDIGFTLALIEKIAEVACIDQTKVYAVGYSNGGFFSHRLACELSDKIAGIASVAGVMGMPNCNPERAIPVLQIHGTYDFIVSYDGGAPYNYKSVNDTMSEWKERLGCSDAAPLITFDQGDTVCKQWVGCDEPLRLCKVSKGGHVWPGGTDIPFFRGKVSTDLNATDMIWQFFLEAQE